MRQRHQWESRLAEPDNALTFVQAIINIKSSRCL